MKKIETGAARPETFPEQWPGQCEVFSHLEYACGIPSIPPLQRIKKTAWAMYAAAHGPAFPETAAAFMRWCRCRPARTHWRISAAPENSASTFFPSGTLTR